MTNRVIIEIHPIEGKYSMIQKSEFMKRATDAVAKILSCSSEQVVVRILESKAENVSRGGIPFSERSNLADS